MDRVCKQLESFKKNKNKKGHFYIKIMKRQLEFLGYIREKKTCKI